MCKGIAYRTVWYFSWNCGTLSLAFTQFVTGIIAICNNKAILVPYLSVTTSYVSWRHRGLPGSPEHLWLRENANELASGFCIPEPLPVHTGIKGRQVHPLIRFCFGAEWMRRVRISTKPFIFVLFPVGVTVRSAESLSSAIPLGTSTKRANSKRANHGRSRLFQDAVSSVSFWLRSVFCLRMTDTIVVFSVWAADTLSCVHGWLMRLLWAYEHDFHCDLAFPLWKDWHPLLPTRADLSGSSRGSPADALGDLRVTVRASPPGTPPRTSYSSRSEHPVRFPGDFAGLSHGAPSISFGAPSVDRMSIAASGDGFTSSEDEGAVGLPPSGVVATAAPDPSWRPCLPGQPWALAGGQQTAQSRALAAGRLVSRSGAWLTTAPCPGAFLPGGAWGADEFVDGPFHGQKPLIRLLRPHYPRWRSGQGVRGHSPGGESGRGALVPTKRRHLEEPSASPVQGL